MMFFRQKRFVFFSLTLLLSILLVAKFASPLYSRAQTATPAAPAATTASSGGAVSCNIPDVFDYVAPQCGGPTATCPNIQGSYIPSSGTPHIGDLGSHIQWLNATTFIQFSGNSQFIYNILNGTVRLAEDNVWGGQYCSSGQKAMYRLVSSDGIGSPQRAQSMSCGQSVSANASLQPYIFDPGINSAADPLNYSLQTCSVAGYGSPQHTEDQLIYGGKALCNPGVNKTLGPIDVAIFKNTVGPGVGEVYVYCKGFGLCAQYDSLSNTPANQPSAWGATTDVCNLQNTTPQNNYYEFNIQRESSQQVLNNFTDEYSVACLPKEEYSVGFENTEKCGTPGVFCPADWKSWDIAGKLQFTADGKAYGLFRDEDAVDSRVANNTAPDRTESVESYLSKPNQNPANGAGGADNTNAGPTDSDDAQKQAPIYTLTTFEQQCNFVVDKLKAVHNLCLPQNRVDEYTTAGQVSPVDNGTTCGLNTSIPGTSTPYDQESMLSAFNSKNMSCHDLANSTDAADQQFLSDLLKVNVSMETAYRPAFIVAVTTFDGPGDSSNVTTNSQDDSGTPPATSGKFQVVDYLEVKIPAVATDFLPPDAPASSSQMNPDRNSYQDPLQLTADVFKTTDQQAAATQQQLTDRAQLRAFTSGTQTFGSIIGNNGNLPVFCNVNGKLVANCDLPAGVGPAYQDQVPQALVKFINAAATLSSQNWDTLPCTSDDTQIYGPTNTQQVAEQAQSIIAQLNAQKAGPYDKRTAISTNINVKVDDVTQGGNIQTNTQLYFVTPQRYALQYSQSSYLSFLQLDQQQGTLANVDQVLSDVADPSKFSPLLKSELNKTLTGQQTKAASEIVGGTVTPPTITTGAGGAVAPVTPGFQNFNLVGLLNDTTASPDNQSVFWRVAGQVASLPTRMMALLTTTVGSQVNDYTKGCTGNFATEDWFTGKCLQAPDLNPASVSSPSAGTTENMCIETKIADTATLNNYANALKGYLAQPTTQSFWEAYFAGYLPGSTVYLFTSNNPACNPTGPCYDTVIDAAVANNINPYLAIAIALNEDGGLKSNLANGFGPHFGCGINPNPPPVISSGSIASKLQCMIGAFNSYASQGDSADQALKTYGYANGMQNPNLTKIIGILSNHTYAGVCTAPDNP